MIARKHLRRTAAAALGLVLAAASAAYGQEFFKGKNVHFVVGYSPGGIFDVYTRAIARHMGKHIPGNPTTVVENMPGAGGSIAANHIYNRAKPDGLSIGAWAAPLVLQQIMGNPAMQFDGRRFGYLGVPSFNDTTCFFSAESGIKTMDDWIAAKRPITLSAIGPGTSTSDVPKIMKVALNLPMSVVDGYKGGADARLAVINREVDGHCSSWQSAKAVWRSDLESGRIRLVVQMNVKRHAELKNVALAVDYAKTDEARRLLKIADDAHGYQFPYSVPPGVPQDRLEILQKAFIDTLKDPEFLAEAKKASLEIEPVDGPTMTKAAAGLYDIDARTISKLVTILVPKK
jgi:tripartite-type tricarboxylate transporter receptor subunit TctC